MGGAIDAPSNIHAALFAPFLFGWPLIIKKTEALKKREWWGEDLGRTEGLGPVYKAIHILPIKSICRPLTVMRPVNYLYTWLYINAYYP